MVDIEKLATSDMKQEMFEKGTIIFNDGDPSDYKMYVLLDGHVGVYKNHGMTGEICIATLSKGDFFGEMSLFLNKARTATIVVAEDVTLLVLDRINIFEFLKNQQDTAFSLIQTLCWRLDSTNASAADNRASYEQDLTALVLENSKMETIVNTDSLTGAYNRRYFREVSRLLIDTATRIGKHSYIVMFDLDFFKKINDTYGHDAGDYVLITFAKMVNEIIRSDDIFARYGGEEFIMLVSCTGKEDAMMLVERIRQSVCHAPFEFGDSKIAVSTSVGGAVVSAGSDLDMAISFADIALYKAKHEGRNRTVFYEEEANEQVVE